MCLQGQRNKQTDGTDRSVKESYSLYFSARGIDSKQASQLRIVPDDLNVTS